MPELWVPGAAGPSVEDFVARLHKAIEQFAVARKLEQVAVEVFLHDGARFLVQAIRPEPGYGFVTLCPHPDDAGEGHHEQDVTGGCTLEELIVPIGSVVRIMLSAPEPPTRFGFAVPQSE